MSADNRTHAASQEMNCLAFRRAKLADPNRLSAAARAHEQGCPGCLVFARRIDANEKRIVRALTVPVPEGLADRVILGATGRRPSSPYRLWALAATVVLSTGIGLAWFARAPVEPQYNFAASAIDSEVTSLMCRRSIFTASASGFSRSPWQVSHSVLDR